MIASTPAQDSLLDYKTKYVVHQVHTSLWTVCTKILVGNPFQMEKTFLFIMWLHAYEKHIVSCLYVKVYEGINTYL